jgi:CubicO group peptidase (beta-lactamase class C family)
MSNPITKYLKNLFAFNRIVEDDIATKGLIKADALLNELVNKKKVPGISITVLKDGSPLFQKGYGFADLEERTRIHPKKTVFRIASVSKNIAATALAHMVKDGLIKLDASFYTYVPYYPKKKWDFTIRQLAGHTGGIRGYRGTEYALNKPYSIKESIEIFKDDALLFQPGTDYLYNSYDWVMISLAMQEASGIPFEDYVNEKVLKPLGLTNTTIEGHPDRTLSVAKQSGTAGDTKGGSSTNELATFYSKNKLGFRLASPVNNYFKIAGGGYLSTSADLANFGQAFLDGKVIDRETLMPFLTSEEVGGVKTYYGLGWQVSEDKNGRSFYGHVGNGVGGYSNFFVYPDEQMVFAILTNCTNPKVQDKLDEIIALLIQKSSKNSEESYFV